MTINFRVASIDGFGDRDDIALAKDRENENRPPNGYTRWEDYHAAQELKANSNSWGVAAHAIPVAQQIEAMLASECYSKLFLKSEIVWPNDEDYTINSALEEAATNLGLDSDDFLASIHDQGSEVEIRLLG